MKTIALKFLSVTFVFLLTGCSINLNFGDGKSNQSSNIPSGVGSSIGPISTQNSPSIFQSCQAPIVLNNQSAMIVYLGCLETSANSQAETLNPAPQATYYTLPGASKIQFQLGPAYKSLLQVSGACSGNCDQFIQGYTPYFRFTLYAGSSVNATFYLYDSAGKTVGHFDFSGDIYGPLAPMTNTIGSVSFYFSQDQANLIGMAIYVNGELAGSGVAEQCPDTGCYLY